ncbi:tRNA acetyltransferase [Pyronema domesticum]|uniref:Similar to Uncharacterized protein C25H2.10c acc. no. P87151 n=1 Tax=Pyronema omphalodes (strain CBS 100304) TaxID=1076935 RepID=U4LPE4_PYROM|nr:tRNA acetyltransferase [Pyronema domesticum]CCX33795.1 Similar to Uncharacterized protein C25H2.10c; acc. no. P87151 [Pyronema omphalodes CBS 100304]
MGKRQRDGASGQGGANKKAKSFNWKKGAPAVIEPGWQGIYVTTDRGREGALVAEFTPILEQCVTKLYPNISLDGEDEEKAAGSDDDEDIEAAIKRELAEAKGQGQKKKKSGPITPVKLDVECVAFFKLKFPLVPTDIVTALCETASSASAGSIRSKYAHRLTPVTKTGKATLEGLKEVAKDVLAPYFHSGQEGVKFAIRPTTRNHNTLKRDEIIKTVAGCVGPAHKVDLKDYDVLILVELYKNTCGMSVVKDFEKYKRFNFGQLQIDASQTEEEKTGRSTEAVKASKPAADKVAEKPAEDIKEEKVEAAEEKEVTAETAEPAEEASKEEKE